MEESFRFTGRATSASAAARRNAERVDSLRGNLTSPSNMSDSSDSEDGGAPLHSGGTALAPAAVESVAATEDTPKTTRSVAALTTIIPALTVDNNSGATYLPPHLRGNRDEIQGQKNQTRSNFQLGNAPTDGDVFGSSDTEHLGSIQGHRDAAGLHLGLPGDIHHQVDSGHEVVVTTGDNDGDMHPASASTLRRNFTSGAMLGSPEARDLGLTTRSASAQILPTSQSSGSLMASDSRHQVGGVDAQAFYSPGACVFVANLPESVDDVHLEAEVTRSFSEYGTVFVKIRRDARNMPFAFCQFTSEADAKVAMAKGKGRMIFGRACRTEPVRANRTYIMHRTNGDHLEVDEAREALADRGFYPLEKCEMLPSDIQHQQGMSRSVLVKLKKFDPTKELQSAFRHHPRYRVIPFDEQKGTQVTKLDPAELWLQRYEVDRRSIFIGDLPYGYPQLEQRLQNVLSQFGEVADIQLVSREPRGDGRTPTTFAFVEFGRPDMAATAVEGLKGTQIFGYNVRVERKVCRDANGRGSQQRFSAARGRTYQSPDYERGQNRFYNALESPETPLRSVEAPRRFVGTNAATIANAATGRYDWSSPTLGTGNNYTTSPYPGSEHGQNAAYNPASPPMPSQYAPHGMMGPPMSPQMGTPLAHMAAANAMSPYALYASQYSWMSPYLADPQYAPYAWAHIANETNTQANTANVAGTETAGENDEQPDTPTRIANGSNTRGRNTRREGDGHGA
ncbi:hypothetical protein G7054_g8646 [Neopestalotiopsis clavispora]|nr:hypothetical protein G7054_g8646 [Neopestalotiopsis clavispora]